MRSRKSNAVASRSPLGRDLGAALVEVAAGKVALYSLRFRVRQALQVVSGRGGEVGSVHPGASTVMIGPAMRSAARTGQTQSAGPPVRQLRHTPGLAELDQACLRTVVTTRRSETCAGRTAEPTCSSYTGVIHLGLGVRWSSLPACRTGSQLAAKPMLGRYRLVMMSVLLVRRLAVVDPHDADGKVQSYYIEPNHLEQA
jgi:hypothetical protein